MLIDKIMNTAYSFGAAVVVFGAWAKFEHKNYSDTALTAGLLTETAIFCLYGFMEWRKKPEGQQQGRKAAFYDEAGVSELTADVKRTNDMLRKVFRAE